MFSNNDVITYNHGAVDDLGSGVGNNASHLMQVHEEIARKTAAIADFFTGTAATAFNDAQQHMLSGFEGLIDVVQRHGATIHSVNEQAAACDAQMAQGFC